MKHPFPDSRAKIGRARKHIRELEVLLAEFSASRPVKVRSEKVVAENGEQAVSIAMGFTGVPLEAGTVVGDVIHNLRAGLDVMACELVRAMGGNDEDVYFPFCDTPEYLDQMIARRNFDRAGVEAVARLRELKPFKGGHIALRAIHDLDIQDKHRSIIPRALNFASPIIRLWDDDGTRNLTIIGDSDAPSLLRYTFPAGTALADQEMVPTLHQLADLAESIIDLFCALANREDTASGT